ncbi:MAG: tRNA-dihydrouridine synthase B [Verrucomicrobiales bacterium]|jgi:tRNA-dihydrouridine synthase B
MLPWFQNGAFPLYLAPMAGVTDVVFRSLCKELGADVMVTEFVSSDGIIQRDDRTRKYTEFSDEQRPVGVQLFGANPHSMAEAAKKVIDWKQPDFIDINFGCPVKKVVSKNGGSSLLRDCPMLMEVAGTVARAVSIPVTAKIRIGWDEKSINAVEVVKRLEDVGMQAISIHGRTRAQGYSGEANWEVIAECAESVSVPVIGNGDLASGEDVKHRRDTTKVSGVMIGRSAMSHPWIFSEAKHYLQTGEQLPPVTIEDRWQLILRHARLALASDRYGGEMHTMQAMRSRLMAYSKGMPAGKQLRSRFSKVGSIMELEDIAADYLACQRANSEAA